MYKKTKTIWILAICIAFLIVINVQGERKDIQAAEPSPDAIAIRVIPNPNHISAVRWYQEQNFSGSPQSIIVDGYEGVRDGRTVYVNAANIDDPYGRPPKFYTNIYLISYNQEAESATIDIFSQILSHWKFNSNLSKGKNMGGQPSRCSQDDSLICISDNDCINKGYCNSFKSQVTRDTIRLARMNDIDLLIKNYQYEHGYFPKLSAGTYLPNKTISVWPSWQDTLAQELGSSLPIDPINQVPQCSEEYNQITCWNEIKKSFAWNFDSIPTKPGDDILTNDSHIFRYESGADGAWYELCAFSETGFIPDVYNCNNDCIPRCYGKDCGDDGCNNGNCGRCGDDQGCVSGKCVNKCATDPGCHNSLDNASLAAGYCASGDCYECNSGYHWDNSSSCVCTPTLSCSDYPEQCGINLSNGCTNTLNCSTNCSDSQICCSGNCKSPDCTDDGDCPDHGNCVNDTCDNPKTCEATCSNTPITNCYSGDNCCPSGCTYSTDNDCVCTPTLSCSDYPEQCGINLSNGCTNTLNCSTNCSDSQICCSGNCKSPDCTDDGDCDDSNACTTDSCNTPNSCTASCSNTQITNCGPDDGCCLSGCTNPPDDDCICDEKECLDDYPGECGSAMDNGCGGVIDCSTNCGSQICCSDICQDLICSNDSDCPAGGVCDVPKCQNGGDCNATCDFEQITNCGPDDGCCPSGCTNPPDDDCTCVPVSLGAINNDIVYLNPGSGITPYNIPTTYRHLAAVSTPESVAYSINVNPTSPAPADFSLVIHPNTGDISIYTTNKNNIGIYTISITATNSCGSYDREDFELSILNNQWCGDGVIQTSKGEICDDGNINNGDGCSESCQWETKTFNCSSKPDNSVWNTVGSYNQVCTASDGLTCINWSPGDSITEYNTVAANNVCHYKCASGNEWDGSACIAIDYYMKCELSASLYDKSIIKDYDSNDMDKICKLDYWSDWEAARLDRINSFYGLAVKMQIANTTFCNLQWSGSYDPETVWYRGYLAANLNQVKRLHIAPALRCESDVCIHLDESTVVDTWPDVSECNRNSNKSQIICCYNGPNLCGNGILDFGEECDGSADCDSHCHICPDNDGDGYSPLGQGHNEKCGAIDCDDNDADIGFAYDYDEYKNNHNFVAVCDQDNDGYINPQAGNECQLLDYNDNDPTVTSNSNLTDVHYSVIYDCYSSSLLQSVGSGKCDYDADGHIDEAAYPIGIYPFYPIEADFDHCKYDISTPNPEVNAQLDRKYDINNDSAVTCRAGASKLCKFTYWGYLLSKVKGCQCINSTAPYCEDPASSDCTDLGGVSCTSYDQHDEIYRECY